MEWLLEWLAMVLEFLFGCRHHNLSRVFTIDRQTYRVCCGCGAKFSYSLATMSIEHRYRPVAFRARPYIQTLRSAE